MKREFLEGLGIEKDTVDKIMAENGADIEKTKSKIETERDNYKDQLETAQKALKEFEGVDVKDLQGKITQLSNDLTAKETEYQNKLIKIEFDKDLAKTFEACRVKNGFESDVRNNLDIEKLMASKNRIEDMKAAVEAVKTSKDVYFISDEPFSNPVKDTGNPDISGGTFDIMRAAMGLPGKEK